MIMNIDTSGLKSIHIEALKIPEYFNRANSIIESINNVTASSGFYKRGLSNKIIQVSQSLVSLYTGIESFIRDIEAMNAKNAILTGEIGDDITIGSTLGNATTAIDYGLRLGVEKLFDFIKTGAAWVYDKTANVYYFFGLEENAEGFIYCRDKALESAAETRADNWYYDKYNNNARYIIRDHTSALPYDGKGCQYISTAASYLPSKGAGIINPLFGAAMLGMYKGGEMSQESLNRSKNESWQGIEEAYNTGKISEEDYQIINAIRNMSDEEYRAIMQGNVSGEVPDEVVNMVKYYHDLPEEWTTSDATNKAMMSATGGFVSGAAQYAIDNKLDNLETGFAPLDSAIRITGNSLSASGEILYDAALLSYTFDTPYFTELENKGGKEGIIAAGLMGGVLTLGGETLRYGINAFRNLANNLSKNRIKAWKKYCCYL